MFKSKTKISNDFEKHHKIIKSFQRSFNLSTEIVRMSKIIKLIKEVGIPLDDHLINGTVQRVQMLSHEYVSYRLSTSFLKNTNVRSPLLHQS